MFACMHECVCVCVLLELVINVLFLFGFIPQLIFCVFLRQRMTIEEALAHPWLNVSVCDCLCSRI